MAWILFHALFIAIHLGITCSTTQAESKRKILAILLQDNNEDGLKAHSQKNVAMFKDLIEKAGVNANDIHTIDFRPDRLPLDQIGPLVAENRNKDYGTVVVYVSTHAFMANEADKRLSHFFDPKPSERVVAPIHRSSFFAFIKNDLKCKLTVLISDASTTVVGGTRLGQNTRIVPVLPVSAPKAIEGDPDYFKYLLKHSTGDISISSSELTIRNDRLGQFSWNYNDGGGGVFTHAFCNVARSLEVRSKKDLNGDNRQYVNWNDFFKRVHEQTVADYNNAANLSGSQSPPIDVLMQIGRQNISFSEFRQRPTFFPESQEMKEVLVPLAD